MNQNSYQTRRLLALRDMRHDGQNVTAGGEVFATQTDASYLIRTGHARDPEVAPASVAAPPAAATAVTAPAQRRPGRPTRVETAARSPAPGAQSPPNTGVAPGADADSSTGGADKGATAAESGEAADTGGSEESGDQSAA